MELLTLLLVIGSLQNVFTSSQTKDKSAGFRTQAQAPGTVSPQMNYPSDGRNDYGREIIEITADPTTASTLHLPSYPIDCTNEKECESYNIDTTPMPTFRPYSQEELNAFLKKYVETNGKLPNGETPTNKLANLYMEEPFNVLDAKDTGKSQEKSKSWQLMQSQAHNHPYDDRTGWVTLEPVPWSASQIQKWEPNSRPQIPHWDKPGYQEQQKPWNKPNNNKWQDRPWNNKPTYEYPANSKPWNNNYNRPSSGWNSDNWGAGSDIITDGGPSHFPHEPAKKPTWYERPHTEVVYHEEKEPYRPHSHPNEGDGHWVLLSSTKGYSVPHRSRAFQRALLLNSKTPTPQGVPSVKSHRSIKLTVLPPLNGTNTTTSHGGLLEVEQTFQTVDEAQREHAAKMLILDKINQSYESSSTTITPSVERPTKTRDRHMKFDKPTNSPSTSPQAARRSSTTIQVYRPGNVHTPIYFSQGRGGQYYGGSGGNGLSAGTIGALSAGAIGAMIPAAVGMLLPLAMGRRRKRSIKTHQIPTELHINYPYYNQ